ncbi:MAG: hypothetical protein IRZ32_00645 [Solirubrobacteraceae bacterium]|nr:hypothetical protein [Solirubrobacteraceae bacterium]
MSSSTWELPGRRGVAIACVGAEDHVDALLRAALATRHSIPPIEEQARVRLVPEPDAIRVYSEQGDPLAQLPRDDEIEQRPALERAVAERGEFWCDARITGREGLGGTWRMQIWVYPDL